MDKPNGGVLTVSKRFECLKYFRMNFFAIHPVVFYQNKLVSIPHLQFLLILPLFIIHGVTTNETIEFLNGRLL
jgi:hypothetical protein